MMQATEQEVGDIWVVWLLEVGGGIYVMRVSRIPGFGHGENGVQPYWTRNSVRWEVKPRRHCSLVHMLLSNC
jgi:hypothetical protein